MFIILFSTCTNLFCIYVKLLYLFCCVNVCSYHCFCIEFIIMLTALLRTMQLLADSRLLSVIKYIKLKLFHYVLNRHIVGPNAVKVRQMGFCELLNFHIFASLRKITPWSIIMYMQSFHLKLTRNMEMLMIVFWDQFAGKYTVLSGLLTKL